MDHPHASGGFPWRLLHEPPFSMTISLCSRNSNEMLSWGFDPKLKEAPAKFRLIYAYDALNTVSSATKKNK